MQQLSSWFYRGSNWLTMLLITGLYAYFISFVMAPQATSMQALIGDWGAPDGHLFYTPDILYAELATWSARGKQQYVDFRLGLDPVWALTYAAFLIIATSIAFRSGTTENTKLPTLNLAAIAPMLADLLENLLGIAIVMTLPQRVEWLAWLAALTTTTKWLTLAAAHLIMLYAIGLAAVVWINTRKSGNKK